MEIVLAFADVNVRVAGVPLLCALVMLSLIHISSKQRASLRGMANTIDTILYIGKEGITDNTVKEAYDALEARELIKCAVQQAASSPPARRWTSCAPACTPSRCSASAAGS